MKRPYGCCTAALRGACALGVLWLASASAWAEDYCCQCRGQSAGQAIEAGNDMKAGLECSLACKRPTLPRRGKCESAPAPAPAAAATPAAATGTVLLYRSDDCSGEAAKVTASAPDLGGQGLAGVRSFMLQSGATASAWQHAAYAGGHSEPVGAGICISPGWEVAGIRLQ